MWGYFLGVSRLALVIATLRVVFIPNQSGVCLALAKVCVISCATHAYGVGS